MMLVKSQAIIDVSTGVLAVYMSIEKSEDKDLCLMKTSRSSLQSGMDFLNRAGCSAFEHRKRSQY